MGGQRSDRGGMLRVHHFEKLAELRDVPRSGGGQGSRSAPPPSPRLIEACPPSRAVDPSSPPSPPDPSGPPDPSSPPIRAGGDDSRALQAAMEGVVPLKGRARVHAPAREINPAVMDEIAQVNAHLRNLVDGVLPFDIADTDEYIEGAVQGLDRRLVRRLRRGEYSVQDHIDLHGFTRDEARAKVAHFIKRAHDRGLRCVLVVHGRGLRSKDQMPVLKGKLKAWLTRGSIGTKVLAFTSAQGYDGGTGAVYVLLRR